MKDVYLYFRRHSTLDQDDDMSNGSVCIPSSAISGIEFSSSSGVNSMQIYFRSIRNNFGMDAATNGTISDYALLRYLWRRRNSPSLDMFFILPIYHFKTVRVRTKRELRQQP